GGARGPGRVLLVLQGAGRAPIPGPEVAEVAAHLARAEADAVRGEGRAKLPGRPGPLLGQQGAEQVGDLLAAVQVGGGWGAARGQGVAPAALEVVQDVEDGAVAVAEVSGDAGGLPAGVGQGDHLQAVPDLGREALAAQVPQVLTGRVVES